MLKLLGSEKTRFLVVGAINTLISYLLFVLFFWLSGRSNYFLAYLLSFAIALLIGFSLQRIFVFRVKGQLLLDFLRYSLVQFVSFAANAALLTFLVELLFFDPLIAQALSLGLTVTASYLAHRHFSFRRKTSSKEN